MDNTNLNHTVVPPTPEKRPFFYGRGVKTLLYILTVFCFVVASVGVVLCQFSYTFLNNGDALVAYLVAALFALLTAGGVVASCFVTGRNGVEKEIRLYSIDQIWVEILLGIGIVCFGIWYSLVSNVPYYYDEDGSYDFYYFMNYVIRGSVVGAITGSAMLTVLLSIVRQLKADTKNFGSIHFVTRKWEEFKAFLRSVMDETRYAQYDFQTRMRKRQKNFILGVLVCAGVGLVFFWTYWVPILAFLALTALCIWFVKKKDSTVEDTAQIMAQIEHISMGDLTSTTQISVLSPLYETSQRLADIQSGFQKSVDEQIKSERMKIELVTNVSHDLKTPLTSIISYVDLLSKEEGLSPEAMDYVKILAQKSERLKNIVADLFTLAKVTSGDETMDYEDLDMSKLVVQTLADMDDKIQGSGFTLKTNIAEPPVPVYADGKRMYRVLQNVIDNALKYAMPGTRIFLALTAEQGRAVFTVKNTAAYEMDFTEEEILERFTRGDKARSTEGNGLGLSIAKGFTEACGGTFRVIIDGDQFKVTVTLPIQSAKAQAEGNGQEEAAVKTPAPTPENVMLTPVEAPKPSQPQPSQQPQPPQTSSPPNTRWNYL